jgi:hypothetical protein
MSSSISSSLSALLASPYASQSAIDKLRLGNATDPFKPGATVTARYTIEEDGNLALRDVNVVDAIDDATSDQAGDKRGNAAQQDLPRYSLSDISKPKANIGPSDEIALFAAPEEQPAAIDYQSELLEYTPPKANGAGITDITLENAKTQPDQLSLAAQKQQRVANLYARNSDLVYNVDPVFSEAA